tara:strand:- start:67 stop:528 length:462 start_codon:yes stop_codon:yes gene_type:complete
MAKLFSFLIIFMALVPFSAKAAVGDTYLCLSSHYVQIKEGEPVRSFRPVKFEFIWDSPKDSDEQIVWFPKHPELIVSEGFYLVKDTELSAEDGEGMFNFFLYPGNESTGQISSGIFQSGKFSSGISSSGELRLTHNYFLGITSLIANCEKTLG